MEFFFQQHLLIKTKLILFKFMKTRAFIFLLLMLSGCSYLSAQTKLPDSKRNSSELYIYKASIENLRQLYLKDKDLDENMLQSFVTSYARNRFFFLTL